MADNKTVDNGALTDYPVATDEVTYSGDTSDVQLIRPVHVSGAEGAKTVTDITDTNGMLVAQATAANLNMTEASASAIKTAVEIMDDWDESDRAKVNPIVGQAGVAAGAGAVGATVQRTTLASDDPAVTSLQVMDDWDNAASDGASVSGDVAHGAVDAGEPIKIGGIVPVDSETTPTEVDVLDRVNAWFERDGSIVTSNREAARQDATWTSATSADTAITIDCSRMGTVVAWAVKSGSITVGALTFEGSVNGGSTWVPLSGSNGNRMQVGVSLTGSDYWNGGEAGWRFQSGCFDRIRIRLSTAITGAGSVVVSLRGVSIGVTNGTVARHQFRQQQATITTTGTDTFDLEGTQGTPALMISNSGSAWSGTIVFEQSLDGSTWTPALGVDVTLTFPGNAAASTTANGSFMFTLASGMRYLRVRGNSVTNTAAIFWSVGTVGVGHVFNFAGGDKAHDAADLSTFPVKIGGKAEATRPTTVADADRTNAWMDTLGRQVVVIGSAERPAIVASETTSNQTDLELIAAPGSNLRIVLYDIVANTGTAGTMLLESGTSTRQFGRISLAANGGWNFNSAKGYALPVNTSLTLTTTTGAGPFSITVNYAIEQDLSTAGVA